MHELFIRRRAPPILLDTRGSFALGTRWMEFEKWSFLYFSWASNAPLTL